MGYTHYFPQMRAFTPEEWKLLQDAFKKISDLCEARGIILAARKQGEEMCTDASILFNGDSENEHEPFVLNRRFVQQASFNFNFCKTQRKPYDFAVMLMLMACHEIASGALSIGSDGDWDDEWREARVYYFALFQKHPTRPFSSEEASEPEPEPEPEIYTYKCRSECPADAKKLQKRAKKRLLATLRDFAISPYEDGTGECEITFSCGVPSFRIHRVLQLNRLRDCHVMEETLALAKNYTGERNWGRCIGVGFK